MTRKEAEGLRRLFTELLLKDNISKLSLKQRVRLANMKTVSESFTYDDLDYEEALTELYEMMEDGNIEELLSTIQSLPYTLIERSKVIISNGSTEYTYNEYLEHIHAWASSQPAKTLQELSELYTAYASTFTVDSAIGHEEELLHNGLQYHRLTDGVYTVRLKEGGTTPFVLNNQQRLIYTETMLVHPRMVLLKTRQTGASTLYLIKGLDDILTRAAFEVGLQAQGLTEAKSLKERADLAYKRIPAWFKDALSLSKDTSNKQELAFSNGSKLRIATSFRSATLNSLHVSELGKIAETDPTKVDELRTGTMQAIKVGNQIVFESTAMGEDNWFYELWEQSLENKLASHGELGDTAFNPVFLSIWDDDDCMMDVTETQLDRLIDDTPSEIIDYLMGYRERYEAELGHSVGFAEISEEAMSRHTFWLSKVKEFGYDLSKMNQEYPDVPSAAFASSKDSSYYTSLLNEKVKSRGRISARVYDPNLDVYAAIDLGRNDTTVIVWFQVGSMEIRVIDAYGNSGESIKHYNNVINDNYKLSRLYLPHDGAVTDLSVNKSREQMFKDGIGVPTTVLTRTSSVQDDIEQVRGLIPNMWFQKGKTDTLYKKLTKYRKKWDEVNEVFKNEPLHNEASNWADAFRYMCVAVHKYHRVAETGKKPKKLKSNIIDGMAIPQ